MKSRKGFTLIELLVVVAIIAVLIAVLMPSLANARRQAKMVKCMSNLRQLSIAVMMYADQHNGTLPPVGMKVNTALSFSASANSGYRWNRLIMPMMNLPEYGNSVAITTLKQINHFVCPEDNIVRSDTSIKLCSYGMNHEVQPPDYVAKYVADVQTPSPIKWIKIQNPGSSILLGDRWTNVNTVNSGVGIDPARCADYHLNGSNYAMADGHVEQVRVIKTFVNTNYLWRFTKD